MLVFGGSQSVQRLDAAIGEAIGDLVTRCAVVHLHGSRFVPAPSGCADAAPQLRERYLPYAFLATAWSRAGVRDSPGRRAGSSTWRGDRGRSSDEACAASHAASHQRANAADAEAAGAARLVPDEELDGDALRAAADLLFDERLASMAAASRSLARPGAAAATAALLVSLVEGAALPDTETLDALTRAVA
jgi:hypothetical protein